jgi:hypothetical protein
MAPAGGAHDRTHEGTKPIEAREEGQTLCTVSTQKMRFGPVMLGLALIQAQPVRAACDTVPASFIARADVYAISAAQMLVEAGCMVGLEVLRRDYEEFQKPSPRRWSPWDANREHFAKEERVPLAEFVRAFNATHTTYASDVRDGVVVIRPVADRAAYLDQRPLRGTLTAKGLFMMHATLTAAMEGRVLSGGVAGSSLGPVGVDIDRGEGVQFSVVTDGKTFVEILNDIITQSPPRGWWVITSSDASARIEQVGFIHRFGSMSGRTVQPP